MDVNASNANVMEIEMIPDYKYESMLSKVGNDKEGEQEDNRRKEELNDIQNQIKELVKKKAEIKKKKDYDISRNNPMLRGEKPLPQRIPRAKPRVLSNVQIILPRIVERKAGELDRGSD